VQLSQVETEKMLVFFVEEELKKRKAAGTYSGKFSAVCSYLGYQVCCCAAAAVLQQHCTHCSSAHEYQRAEMLAAQALMCSTCASMCVHS
jgi:sugar phosphate permease